MFDKMAIAVFSAYFQLKAKARDRIERLKEEEDGMETIEAIILIAIAVIIAGVLVNALTQKDWGDGEEHGLVGYIFKKIVDSLGFLDDKPTV
ncbi:MAG TPA: hypothetical protein DCP68_04210 [Ruminococcus sp.]|nr:hypothetical protein [Ruminococcus sp.]